MQGCESELPGEKLDVFLRPAGPQLLDSTEDRRSTILDRHSRLDAPTALSSTLSDEEDPKFKLAKFGSYSSACYIS